MIRRHAPGSLLTVATLAAGALCIENSAGGQTFNGSIHFIPSTFQAINTSVGRGPSGNYLFSRAGRSFVVNRNLEFKLPWNSEQHTYLFGPEFHGFIGKYLTVNGWVRGGVAKRFSLLNPLSEPVDATPPHYGLFTTPLDQSTLNGANGATVSFGANANIRFGDHLSYQVVQAERLRVRVDGRPIDDRRYSTGLRLSFGK